MISRTSDINRTFHTIYPLTWRNNGLWHPMTSPIYLISSIIMSPARRDGAVEGATGQELCLLLAGFCLATANEVGTGFKLNGSGLDPAQGLISVDAVQVIPTAASCCRSNCLCNLKPQLGVQVEAPHWQWAWSLSPTTSTAQVGHLVIASFRQSS